MPYLDKFVIELDNKSHVYFPGDRVTGLLTINVNQSTKISSISIKAKGEAYVNWSEPSSKDSSTSNWTRLPYVDKKLVVLEKEGNHELVLDVGEQEFSFSFELPDNIPTSFESSNGRIRYWIEAVIEKKFSIGRHTHTTFTVIKKHDLNMIPYLRLPTSVNEQKKFFWTSLNSKPVEITFDIQKTGFVCGETAIMNVMINNQSNRIINTIEINLYKRIILKANGCTKKDRINLTKYSLEGRQVQPKSEESFRNLKIKIPPTCPSLGETCSLIKSKYKFELKVKGNGLTTPVYLKIPIEIGTVPIIRDTTDISQTCSYEQVKSRGENNDGQIHIHGFINFYNPLYPVFLESINTEKNDDYNS